MVSESLFGATLQPQGRGYYVALELLALARGLTTFERSRQQVDPKWAKVDQQHLLDPAAERIVHLRNSQDFIRRLMYDPSAGFLTGSEDHPKHDLAAGLPEPLVLHAVSDLLKGLVVPVPYVNRKDWYTTHLFPYEGDLVLYDAQQRRNPETNKYGPALERDRFRGGGLLAYDILRTDRDDDRRQRVAAELGQLVEDSGQPLGRTVASLGKFNELDELPLEEQFVHWDVERRERSPFAEEMRDGVYRILQLRVDRARKVQYLMQWIPLVIALHQRELCYRVVGDDAVGQELVAPPIPLAMVPNAMIRSASRNCLRQTRQTVSLAMDATLERLCNEGLVTESASEAVRSDAKSKWRDEPSGFFANTMAAVGALNANTGRRHFTLSASLAEAIVAATIGDGGSSFREFADEVLGGRLGLTTNRQLVGPASINGVEFRRSEMNERALEALLLNCGLLDQLSDSNSIVFLPVEGIG